MGRSRLSDGAARVLWRLRVPLWHAIYVARLRPWQEGRRESALK
jgi:hypothetical protein